MLVSPLILQQDYYSEQFSEASSAPLLAAIRPLDCARLAASLAAAATQAQQVGGFGRSQDRAELKHRAVGAGAGRAWQAGLRQAGSELPAAGPCCRPCCRR